MTEEFKNKLRLLKVDVLRLLLILCTSKSFALEVDEMSKSTSTSEPELKGIVSTLRRIKISDKPIILPAGRDIDGRLRWKIDEASIDKKELAEFLTNEILGKDSITWQK